MRRIMICLALTIFPLLALAQGKIFEDVLQKNFEQSAIPRKSKLEKGARIYIKKVQPTFFFVEEQGMVLQLVKIELSQIAGKGLKVKALRAGNLVYENPISISSKSIIKIPDLRENAELELKLIENGKEIQSLIFDWVPARQWKVYISFVSHLDIGYTDLTENVFKKRNQITETALKYAEQTKDFPEDARWRWTSEGSWEIKNFLQEHPERLPELQRLAREGRLEVCAKLVHMHIETAGYESLFRELYYAKRELEPLLGTEILTANLTDVAGIPWGEATVMPVSGVKYFLFNPNLSYRGANIIHKTRFPQAYYWQGPDARSILTWRSKDSYGEAPYLLTNYANALPRLTELLLSYEKNNYAYDAIHLTRTGPEWDNTIPKLEPVLLIKEWNQNFKYPRLVSATPKMFFEYLEKNFGKQIPVAKGDKPDWWADGVITEAKEEGISRDLHHKLFATEALASFASLVSPGYQYPVKAIDDAYFNSIMFDEHTWGFHNIYAKEHQQIFQQKAGWLHTALDNTEKIQTDTLSILAQQIAGSEPCIIVFNPLPWRTSVLVRKKLEANEFIDLDKIANSRLIDPETNQEIYGELINSREDGRQFEFFAPDIPAFGYKSFKIVSCGKINQLTSSLKAEDGVLENQRFKLTIDEKKGLVGIYDKKLKRELVDQSAKYTMGQLIRRKQSLFDLIDSRRTFNIDRIEYIADRKSASVKLYTFPAGKPEEFSLIQTITLYDGEDYIDLENYFTPYENREDEAIYLAFPFNVPDFEIWYETPYGKSRPFYEQLPDYAKFYVVSHNVELKSKSENFSIIWSTKEAPMVEFGEITKRGNRLIPIYNPGKYPWNPDKPHIYSEIMNNYQSTNFSPFQKGEGVWHYRITAIDASESDRAHRSGWELSMPELSILMKSGAGKLPPSGSLVKVSPDNVMITAFKKAEDGDGYILRIYEVSGKPAQARLEFPLLKISEAWFTDGVERNLEKILIKDPDIKTSLGAYEIKTIRIKGGLK